jgi:hypothetical protein
MNNAGIRGQRHNTLRILAVWFMKKFFILISGISFTILLVSSVFDIFFPITVVGSAAQLVPMKGRDRLWYWLAGINQPNDAIIQNKSEEYFFGFSQEKVDQWIFQYMADDLPYNLIWANNLLFAPMDQPIFTDSPAYDFDWMSEYDPTNHPEFICAPLVVGGTTYQTDFYGSDNGPNVWEHTGIDFGTNNELGLPVISPMEGIVVYATSNGGWGNTVIIQNGAFQVWLAHAIQFNVDVGQIVEAGDVVMFSGGSPGADGAGNSSGPHLHFEVRYCTENDHGKAQCEIVNPNSVLLPGQEEICFWSAQVSEPELNWAPFVMP